MVDQSLNPGGAQLPLLGWPYPKSTRRYLFALRYARPGLTVDFGCGFGYGTSLLAEGTKGHTTGFDVDKRCVRWATKHFASEELEFQLLRAIEVPLPARSVGLMTSFEVIEHLNPGQVRTFLREARRVLAPGSVLVGSTPNVKAYACDSAFHLHEFAPDELVSLLREEGFEVELFGQGIVGSDDRASLTRHIPDSIVRMRVMRILGGLLTAARSKVQPPAPASIEVGPFSPIASTSIVFVGRPGPSSRP